MSNTLPPSGDTAPSLLGHPRTQITDAPSLPDDLPTVIADAPECEALAHIAGMDGHDDGPARFVVRVDCPNCDALAANALLCEGRVLAVTSSFCTMRCPRCGLSDEPWESFWTRIEAI